MTIDIQAALAAANAVNTRLYNLRAGAKPGAIIELPAPAGVEGQLPSYFVVTGVKSLGRGRGKGNGLGSNTFISLRSLVTGELSSLSLQQLAIEDAVYIGRSERLAALPPSTVDEDSDEE